MEKNPNQKKPQQKPESKSTPKNSRVWLSLAGVGFQMGITIFLGAYAGKYLDAKYPSDKNWWTIGLTMAAVGISLYNLIKQVNRINKKLDQ